MVMIVICSLHGIPDSMEFTQLVENKRQDLIGVPLLNFILHTISSTVKDHINVYACYHKQGTQRDSKIQIQSDCVSCDLS